MRRFFVMALGLSACAPVARPTQPAEVVEHDPPTGSASAASRATSETEKQRATRELLEREEIGGVRLGMTGKEVIAILGRPSDVFPSVRDAPTGRLTTRWYWKADGIELMFIGPSSTLAKLRGLALTGPSPLETTMGIGIGSTLEEVDAAYFAVHDDSKDKENYVIGGEEGMVFEIGGGKVGAVYWGLDLGP